MSLLLFAHACMQSKYRNLQRCNWLQKTQLWSYYLQSNQRKRTIEGNRDPTNNCWELSLKYCFFLVSQCIIKRNNCVYWLYYWTTRLCQFLTAKFQFFSMLFTILYNYCLILINCFCFSYFSSLINCWILLWHSKEKRSQPQHPPSLVKTNLKSWHHRNERKYHFFKSVMSFHCVTG